MPLTPLLRSLNLWHVSFSTHQRTLVTILTLLRCVICQTLLKTLPKTSLFCRRAPFLTTIPPLVKALHQAPILQHHVSQRLAGIPPIHDAGIPPIHDLCMACSLGCLPDLNWYFYWSWIKVPSILCHFLPKLVRLHLRFCNNSSPSLTERFATCE